MLKTRKRSVTIGVRLSPGEHLALKDVVLALQGELLNGSTLTEAQFVRDLLLLEFRAREMKMADYEAKAAKDAQGAQASALKPVDSSPRS